MAISPGTRLGPYEVLGPLGSGGMGEVYRARDSRLGREVAVKVLPEEFSADAGRLQRFEQEARAASALNHPNIVTVHDIGKVGSVPYIAMELVEGNSVRELMTSGPLPVRRLLGIAAQCAEGLAKAHGAGIVHRDLKPENLMVSSDGFVKILDFGLAKLVANSAEVASRVPTMARPETHPGTVMGTVGYMSPEQASGQALDFRSDQFSFGSILYEMTTGKRAFQRPTNVDTLAAILHEDPEPIAALAPRSPAPLRWIVDRCLAKDPKERYASTVDLARDLASVRQHISELSGGETALPSGGRRRTPKLAVWSLAAASLLVGLAAGFLARGRGGAASETRPPMRLNLTFPAAQAPVPFPEPPGPTLALSPDGTRLVYVGLAPEGTLLYQRPLDQFVSSPIPGTAGAMEPFFSPDGRWIGFWADRKLKKVSLAGGQPLTLCDAPTLRGASWSPDGTIVFTPFGAAGLWRVSDKGGEPRRLTTIDKNKGEGTHRWPEILPGGKAAIFTVHGLSGSFEKAKIGVVLLETGERRILIEGATDARYLPTGHLVYLRGDSLFAIPFDVKRLAITGSPLPVLDGLAGIPIVGLGNYAFTPAGHLVYFPTDPRWFERELVWMDRKGNARSLAGERRAYSEVRFSPDGRHLATVAGASDSDIWIYDLTRSSWDRLTQGGVNNSPVWSPHGQSIAFASNRDGPINPYWMPLDRSRPPEQLVKSDEWIFPTSFSPDGRTVLLVTQTPETNLDISTATVDGDRTIRPFIQTPSYEGNASFSPDGRFVAYDTDASGLTEVFVTGYPGPRGRWQVSAEGGHSPLWSRDGRELFYLAASGKLMVVAVETSPEFRAGVPAPLFDPGPASDYDVAPDGQSFAVIRKVAHEEPAQLSVVLNWFNDVRRRMTAEKKPQ